MQVITFISAAALVGALTSGVHAAARVEVASTIRACVPAAIQYSNAADGPVYLSVVIGKNTAATGDQIKFFPTQHRPSGSYVWDVDIAPGTQLTFIVNDATGTPNYSSQITVNGSNDCNAPATFAADDSSSASAPTGGAATSMAAPTATSPTSNSSASSSRVATSTTRSSGAPAATSSNGSTSGAVGSLRSVGGVALAGAAALFGAFVALA